VGAHKGKKWKDKPAKVRYHGNGQRLRNKLARVTRCNGPEFTAAWKRLRGIA
jgi:hypothetical protein